MIKINTYPPLFKRLRCEYAPEPFFSGIFKNILQKAGKCYILGKDIPKNRKRMDEKYGYFRDMEKPGLWRWLKR